MANLAPSPATRFRSGVSGNPSGRPSVKWLREEVDAVDKETGDTQLKLIAKHLVEVAKSWEIIHQGEGVKVASARDSVEASRLILQVLALIRKPAPSDEEQLLKVAEHFRAVAADFVNLGLKVLGGKADAMKPEEIAKALQAFAIDPRSYLAAAEEYTARTAEQQSEQPAIAEREQPQVAVDPPPSEDKS